ncbi:MAG TPA: maleylpyruvate isomerase family mycothiol-dependent enzyme [Streptosporangiaceae bacterium]|jgi:uncharacterized protein (TIGR03083 family)
MAPVSTQDFYAEITASTATMARLLAASGPDLPVPTCPGWTMRKLATHVGRAQRWAGHIVATRSPELIPYRSAPDGKLPADPAAWPAWLRAGAQLVTSEITAAGEDRVWTFVGPRPASFWARRMAHETAVHRADAELAAGDDPVLGDRIAADGIDEWLGFLPGPDAGQAGEPGDPRLTALPDGGSLHVHVTGDGLDGTGEWLIRREGPGLTVSRGHAKADAAIRGPAGRVLLALVRRIPADDRAIEVLGDRELVTRWLANTPY